MSRETANAARYAKGLCVLSELEGDQLEALEVASSAFSLLDIGSGIKGLIDKAIDKANGNP